MAQAMTPDYAQKKLAEAAQQLGREVRVFLWEAAVPRDEHIPDADVSKDEAGLGDAVSGGTASERQPPPGNNGEVGARPEDTDDFYNLTTADYARLVASRKEERFLKLKKHRDQELQERRSRIHKAVIRVLFPDGFIVESTFNPSDSVADVRELVKKCIRDPGRPFYFFTAPPKKPIKDETVDLYTAELAPGALVYFSLLEPETGVEGTKMARGESLLSQSVMDLKDLHMVANSDSCGKLEVKQSEPQEEERLAQPKLKQESSGQKKPGVPKWFKR